MQEAQPTHKPMLHILTYIPYTYVGFRAEIRGRSKPNYKPTFQNVNLETPVLVSRTPTYMDALASVVYPIFRRRRTKPARTQPLTMAAKNKESLATPCISRSTCQPVQVAYASHNARLPFGTRD
jgi:hypothetical protein